MLRSSELYAPGISLTEDPEAMGFMDGLMEVNDDDHVYCKIILRTAPYLAQFLKISCYHVIIQIQSSNSIIIIIIEFGGSKFVFPNANGD